MAVNRLPIWQPISSLAYRTFRPESATRAIRDRLPGVLPGVLPGGQLSPLRARNAAFTDPWRFPLGKCFSEFLFDNRRQNMLGYIRQDGIERKGTRETNDVTTDRDDRPACWYSSLTTRFR